MTAVKQAGFRGANTDMGTIDIQEAISRVIREIVEKRDTMVREALTHHGIPLDDENAIRERVQLLHGWGRVENVLIDNTIVLTFTPPYYNFEEGKMEIKFKRHYTEGEPK